ncbi:restriction endonuclease subunit S [Shewanella algae]|uniref:restriction endonuclease subunit S n=1 Tax=Shewanella algae TaxID=38313 RepID=UPI00399B639E
MESLALMPKYEAYKESGVDWLGEVPDCWDLVPIRGLLNFRNEKNDPIVTEDVLSLSIANGVTQYSDEGRGGNKRKDDLTAYKIARPNDIVMNSMNVIVGAVGVSKYFGAISPVYYALYAKDDSVLISFYERIFQNEGFQRGLLRLGKGILIKFGDSGKMNTIRMKISQNDLKVLMFPKPDSKTQLLISNFLDQKTAQIDEAIAIKELQISLLKERKQIIIQQAVTQGLDPNVPMKDSGVDWIGKIPAHWGTIKLKFVTAINSRVLAENTPSNKQIEYVDIGSVSFENGIEKTERFAFKDAPSRARRLAKEGDIIVSTVRTYLKAISAVDEKHSNSVYSTGFAVLEPLDMLCSTFLAYFTKSDAFTIQVTLDSKGMSYPAINSSDLSNLTVVLPPKHEQEDIVEFIEKGVNRIQAGIHLNLQQIQKLKEYKTTLINSAVTGKIKITQEMLEQ